MQPLDISSPMKNPQAGQSERLTPRYFSSFQARFRSPAKPCSPALDHVFRPFSNLAAACGVVVRLSNSHTKSYNPGWRRGEAPYRSGGATDIMAQLT
jgi:hypothetical protein